MMKKIIVLAAALAGGASAYARITNYWVGASGNWSEPSNWYLDSKGTIPANHYPGQDPNVTDDVALFAPTASGTVTLDVDATIRRFSVEESSKSTSMTFESDPENPHTLLMTTTTPSSIKEDTSIKSKRTVTFRNIKLRCISLDFRGGKGIFDSGADVAGTSGDATTIYAWSSGCLIRYLDGCVVNAVLHAENQNGTHQIEGGEIVGKISPNSQYTTVKITGGTCNFSSGSKLTQNSVLDISGGTVSMSSLTVPAAASVIISGGDVTLTSAPAIDASATVIFTNGTLTAKATTTDSRLLGTENAVFISTVAPTDSNYKTKPSINVAANDGDEISCATIFATNGLYSALHFDHSAVFQAKTVNATRLTINAAKNVTLLPGRLNLGARLFPTLDGASLTVPEGITFGAFGDWYVYDKKFSIDLGGSIICDTTDCFDGVTPRKIGLTKVVIQPNTSLDVIGNGSLLFTPSGVTNRFTRIAVDDGATLMVTSITRQVYTDRLELGEGSTLRLRIGSGSIDTKEAVLASTASILLDAPTSRSYDVYPVVSAVDDETAFALAAKTVLVGDDAARWGLSSVGGTVFVTNDTVVSYGETTSNIWTGVVDGNWSTSGNWASGAVPRSSNYDGSSGITAYFGPGNPYVTNDYNSTYVNRIHFLKDCWPIVLSGNFIRFKASTANPSSTGSAIYSQSRLPVTIDAELYHGSNLGVVSVADSYIALNGKTRCDKFYPSGEIRVGGTLSCTQVLPKGASGSGRLTTVHVTDGGFMSVAEQTDAIPTGASRLVVDGGGTLVFSNETGSAVLNMADMRWTHVVNGLLDMQCPYKANRDMVFSGTGTVHVAAVSPTIDHSAAFIIGGGLTLKPKSWTTVTADAPDNYTKIAVNDDAVLSAAADWTYGPERGVATATTAAERAIEIPARATLTVKTDGHTVSFADPIAGEGSLVVAEGSKAALAGDLLAAAKGGWTTFATVGSFECAAGVFPANYVVRTVDNGDGTFDVQARVRPGAIFTLR